MKTSLLKNLLFSTISIVFFSTTTPIFASDQLNVEKKPATVPLEKQLKTTALSKRMIAIEIAPIKNSEQLHQLLSGNSALDQLSVESKQRFVDSLVFSEKGLGGFYYGNLERELSPTGIYKILSLFGYQDFTFKFTGAKSSTTTDALIMSSGFTINSGDTLAFREGYQCVSSGSCKWAPSWLCTSNC